MASALACCPAAPFIWAHVPPSSRPHLLRAGLPGGRHSAARGATRTSQSTLPGSGWAGASSPIAAFACLLHMFHAITSHWRAAWQQLQPPGVCSQWWQPSAGEIGGGAELSDAEQSWVRLGCPHAPLVVCCSTVRLDPAASCKAASPSSWMKGEGMQCLLCSHVASASCCCCAGPSSWPPPSPAALLRLSSGHMSRLPPALTSEDVQDKRGRVSHAAHPISETKWSRAAGGATRGGML